MSRPDCERCDVADARARGLLRGLVAVAVLSLRARPASVSARALQGYGASMAAMLGAALPPSPYGAHRAAYVATGDLTELARMLRHVADEWPP
jgi:hypothetical protein